MRKCRHDGIPDLFDGIDNLDSPAPSYHVHIIRLLPYVVLFYVLITLHAVYQGNIIVPKPPPAPEFLSCAANMLPEGIGYFCRRLFCAFLNDVRLILPVCAAACLRLFGIERYTICIVYFLLIPQKTSKVNACEYFVFCLSKIESLNDTYRLHSMIYIEIFEHYVLFVS